MDAMDCRITPPLDFGREHFSNAKLGDKRRTDRLVYTANRMIEHPGGTLPHKLDEPKDLKGLYRLANTDAVTHAAVLESHYQRTWRLMAAATEVVLNIHDTTELDYSGLDIEGLGQIGNGHGHGYECHNTLAVGASSGAIFGLANQILFHRPHAPKRETRKQRQQRANRESRLWKQGSAALPTAPPDKLWVDVCDRGADVSEFLAHEEKTQRHYLVRSQHNRRVRLGPGRRRLVKLHDWARQLPVQDEYSVAVEAQNKQPARTARVTLAWGELWMQPPRQARGEHGPELLHAWVVIVREVAPPAGVTPVEWILLTNVAVTNLAEARERVAWYGRRPLVEAYHKGLKTGCGIEELPFTTEAALQPVIALLSVVTLVLLELRTASRWAETRDRPATDYVPWEHVDVLSAWRWPGEAPRRDLTVYEFCYALGRLGGHQNRKSDRPPGWLVLQRGWTKLQARAEGARMKHRKNVGKLEG